MIDDPHDDEFMSGTTTAWTGVIGGLMMPHAPKTPTMYSLDGETWFTVPPNTRVPDEVTFIRTADRITKITRG